MPQAIKLRCSFLNVPRSGRSPDKPDAQLEILELPPHLIPSIEQHHSSKPVICSISACLWLCITIGEPHKNILNQRFGATCVHSHSNCPNTGNRDSPSLRLCNASTYVMISRLPVHDHPSLSLPRIPIHLLVLLSLFDEPHEIRDPPPYYILTKDNGSHPNRTMWQKLRHGECFFAKTPSGI